MEVMGSLADQMCSGALLRRTNAEPEKLCLQELIEVRDGVYACLYCDREVFSRRTIPRRTLYCDCIRDDWY